MTHCGEMCEKAGAERRVKYMQEAKDKRIGAFPILFFFEWEHLREAQQHVSRPFYDIAHDMTERLGKTKHKAELAAGLRHLLEAKDCLVRASLVPTDLKEKKT